AIEKGLDVTTLEKLLAMKERVDKERAREAFVEAMAEFQGACPIIEKTKVVLNKDGKSVRYKFAPLDAIVEQIKEPLKDNGLAYRWEVENKEGLIKAICIVTHKMGHSEKSDFEIPIDKE